MARPGYAARRRDEFEDNRLDYTPAPRYGAARIDATRVGSGHFEVSGYDFEPDARPTIPRRVGTGSRPKRRRPSHGLLLWRVLGVSAATLILGMGGVLAYHLAAPADGAAPQAPVQAAAPAQPRQVVDAGHAQAAMKVASILGSGVDAAAVRGPATADENPAPTAADFARPAFLEPLGDDEAGDAAGLPDRAAEAGMNGAPPETAAPLPSPKPARMASADTRAADDDAGSARIRSDVTLRSGPRRSASVLGTLDAGTRVKLYSCKSWCEVSSGSKRGYVYKSAVAR